jgi:hypothetical protein
MFTFCKINIYMRFQKIGFVFNTVHSIIIVIKFILYGSHNTVTVEKHGELPKVKML